MSKYNFEQKRNDYETPPELVKKALSIVDYDLFYCDVCCSRDNIPAAHHYIYGETDGLKQNWYLLNWCNPPFNECSKWIKKAFEEQQKGNRTIMLLPVRTETKYWHDYILFKTKKLIFTLYTIYTKSLKFFKIKAFEKTLTLENFYNLHSLHKKISKKSAKFLTNFYGVFMEIKGKVHCFFEQSGTFKNEFIKLGIPAEDYDIQNNFNETDHIIDLFAEIEKGYEGKESIFNNITQDDLIIAFFPCIYFTGSTNPCYFRLENINYKCLSLDEKLTAILDRAAKREYFYELLYKLIGTCLKKDLRIVLENPYSSQHFLHNNFFGPPTIIDKNRLLRGDYFHKPTGYWFFNCEATYGESFQNDKDPKKIWDMKRGKAGLCSEERSMISPDYARNFICDFILGKVQDLPQQRLNLEF